MSMNAAPLLIFAIPSASWKMPLPALYHTHICRWWDVDLWCVFRAAHTLPRRSIPVSAACLPARHYLDLPSCPIQARLLSLALVIMITSTGAPARYAPAAARHSLSVVGVADARAALRLYAPLSFACTMRCAILSARQEKETVPAAAAFALSTLLRGPLGSLQCISATYYQWMQTWPLCLPFNSCCNVYGWNMRQTGLLSLKRQKHALCRGCARFDISGRASRLSRRAANSAVIDVAAAPRRPNRAILPPHIAVVWLAGRAVGTNASSL